MRNGSTRGASFRGISRCPDWATGALLSLACGFIYLAVRPPLFDNDGYRDRLDGLQASWLSNANPHHLLWIFVEALIGRVAAWLGDPTTVPFQMFGILVNCATLFFLFILLSKCSADAVFAALGVLLVAFSPVFWYLGLQNRPDYTLLFLTLVLYLLVWHTEGGSPPSGLRLLSAGFLLVTATLLHQAAILLVPAGVIVLVTGGSGTWVRRLIHGLVWGGSIAAIVLLVYLGAWLWIDEGEQKFLRWTTSYAYSIHAPDLFDFGLPKCLVQTVMGISAVLVQSASIQSFLENSFSNSIIVAIYGAIGILAGLAIAVAVWSARQLIQSNALLTLSLLSILFWSGFAFAWEPVTPHFWLPALFPALVCLGLLLRHRAGHGVSVFAAIALLVSAWNGYFNREYDRVSSINFPEPLLATIQQHVAPHDIFIVLAQDGGIGGMDYDLLLTCLQYSPRNPAVAILDDLVWPAGNSQVWQEKLRDRINATLDSGGHVFVAAHVLASGTYENLSGADDPFSAYVSTRYLTTEGLPFYREVRQVFAIYKLKESGLSIGTDRYFLLQRN